MLVTHQTYVTTDGSAEIQEVWHVTLVRDGIYLILVITVCKGTRLRKIYGKNGHHGV